MEEAREKKNSPKLQASNAIDFIVDRTIIVFVVINDIIAPFLYGVRWIMQEYEDAFKKMQGLHNEYHEYTRQQLSESDTRCKLIDRLFIDILNWNEGDIKREHSENGAFADYIFSTSRELFVVEAKKQDIWFEIPTGKKTRRRKIFGLSTVPYLKDAIEQAHGYASDNGLRYVIVTNGHQYVIFKSFTEGKPWKNEEALVFYDFDDMLNNFAKLWNLLEKEHVVDGSIPSILLSDMDEIKRDRKIIDDFGSPGNFRDQNQLAHQLKPILKKCFADIDFDNGEMLENCYCKSHETTLADTKLRSFLHMPYPKNFDRYVKNLSSKHGPDTLISAFGSYNDGEIVLLCGSVGSGKSIFLNWFYKTIICKMETERPVWIYVDYRYAGIDPAVEGGLIRKRTLDAIEKRLREYADDFDIDDMEFLKQVYYSEVVQYRKLCPTLYENNPTQYNIELEGEIRRLKSNQEEHVTRVIKHLISQRNKKAIIVLDNIDQFQSKLQEDLYLEAQRLKSLTHAVVVLSLRESTYWRASTSARDAFAGDTIFTIRTPRVVDMLAKRLHYQIDAMKGSVEARILWGKNMVVHVKDIIPIFEKMLDGVLGDEEVVTFLECISNKNARKSLEMFSNFITSGHTRLDYALDLILRNKEVYTFPKHEFVKSVIYGDRENYSENHSTYVMNIFGNRDASAGHYLLLRILHFLEAKSKDEHRVGVGFVLISEVVNHFMGMDYRESCVLDSIRRLLKYGCVETERLDTSIDYSDFFRITLCGKFYLSHIWSFVYVDSIIVDTPISDQETYSKLKAMLPEGRWPSFDIRLQRTKLFIEYLANTEIAEIARMHRKGVKSIICHSAVFRPLVENDMSRIEQRVAMRRSYAVSASESSNT